MNVAVVIPLFNKRPHIERALRSVFDQELKPAEIIVVDDGSTDGSLEIVREFEGVEILTRDEPGPGGYAARNVGINAASTEWIAFLDADDHWFPCHLKTLSEAVESCEDTVGCVFSVAKIVDGIQSRKYRVSPSLPKAPEVVHLSSFLSAWITTARCPMWTGAVAIRRESLIACGMFPAGKALRGGDKDTWLRVMGGTAAVFTDTETVAFTQDSVNRVTKGIDYTKLPIIVETVNHMLASADVQENRLLQDLSNLELVNYARHAAAAGTPLDFSILARLRHPKSHSGLKIAAFIAASAGVRLLKLILQVTKK